MERVVWSKRIGSSNTGNHDFVNAGCIHHQTGDIIFVGRTIGTVNDAFITKVSGVTGSLHWSRRFSTPPVVFNGVVSDSSGNIVVAGDIDEGQIVLWKFSAEGGYSFARKFGIDKKSAKINSYNTLKEIDDTGYIVVGKLTGIGGRQYYNAILSKWDYNLNRVWTIYIGERGSTYTALPSKDGNSVFMAVNVAGDCEKFYKFRTNSIIQDWVKYICWNGYSASFEDIAETENTIVIVGYFSLSPTGGMVLELSKSDGSIIKANYIPHNTLKMENFYSATTTINGSVIILGQTLYETGTPREGIFIKLNDYREICHMKNVSSYFVEKENHVNHWGTFSPSYWDVTGDYISVPLNFTIIDSSKPVQQPLCHSCFGVDFDSKLVCSGHGLCENWDSCSCNPQYPGKNCHKWECYGITADDTSKVCGNNITKHQYGTCTDINQCYCIQGYQSDYLCVEWYCDGISYLETDTVCSGRGECQSDTETCSCFDNYKGKYCETWECMSIDVKNSHVCNGHGNCISPESCRCSVGYNGEYCINSYLFNVIFFPLLGFGLVFFFLTVCCVFFLVVVVLCLVCCSSICGIGMGFSFRTVLKQRTGINRYRKLDNFDMLLQEQLIEKDVSVPHLKIEKEMFKIDFDEVKILSMCGEGGSTAVVYKAEYHEQIVAFKCFKTRRVTSTESTFEEFEKEVKILSSVLHPSIVAFYGCSLKPPRIGLLMEFCENGEIFEFLLNFNKENGGKYPLEEKLRMMKEIVAAMNYLHSRKIIHRDLKCENILINSEEKVKLMDFGISRIWDNNMKMTEKIGTSYYIAPEVITSGGIYDVSCDVFSFAMVVFIIFTENEKPYGKKDYNIQFKVANSPTLRPSLKELKDSLTEKYHWITKLVEKCWDSDSKERPTFSQIQEEISELEFR